MDRNHFKAALLLLFLLLLFPLLSAHDAKGKPVTLKGEIVDLQCYLVHPDSSVGADHAKCAEACMLKGLPIGLLAEDGSLYLLIGPGHDSAKGQVAKYAGKSVTVNGVLLEVKGMKSVQIKSVAE